MCGRLPDSRQAGRAAAAAQEAAPRDRPGLRSLFCSAPESQADAMPVVKKEETVSLKLKPVATAQSHKPWGLPLQVSVAPTRCRI